MVMYSGMIHTASIKRVGHIIIGRKKLIAETTIATNIECRIQPLADVPAFSALGRTASEAYVGFFPEGTGILVGDKIIWTNRGTTTFMVEGVTDPSAGGYSDVDHHEEANLKRMAVE